MGIDEGEDGGDGMPTLGGKVLKLVVLLERLGLLLVGGLVVDDSNGLLGGRSHNDVGDGWEGLWRWRWMELWGWWVEVDGGVSLGEAWMEVMSERCGFHAPPTTLLYSTTIPKI